MKTAARETSHVDSPDRFESRRGRSGGSGARYANTLESPAEAAERCEVVRERRAVEHYLCISR